MHRLFFKTGVEEGVKILDMHLKQTFREHKEKGLSREIKTNKHEGEEDSTLPGRLQRCLGDVVPEPGQAMAECATVLPSREQGCAVSLPGAPPSGCPL